MGGRAEEPDTPAPVASAQAGVPEQSRHTRSSAVLAVFGPVYLAVVGSL